MATPTLNTISSYSVDDGVTLTFNANYGTNLVRGSVLTIMDMYDNVLAWHIYIPSTYASASTVHVLPSKQALINESTTPSAYNSSTAYSVDDIVAYQGATYKCVVANTGDLPTSDSWVLLGNVVGKFSYIDQDFVTDYINEQQYQYNIQTFVSYENDLILNGRSGNSNKVSAWALPNPTIIIDTIGTNNIINTTSYTIGATYNTNIQTSIINDVYNPPKTVEFELYELTGGEWELIQTSGVVYNGGTMVNEDSYYMNYTFKGMSNGSTYKVAMRITSLLGMVVKGESNAFSIDAVVYQLGAFSVNNDGCSGRIIIKSDIINISGRSEVEPEDGEIDLSGGDGCTWSEGLSFTNNWTSRIWLYNPMIAPSISSEYAVAHLGSSSTGGVIDIYVLEDNSDTDYVKVGLYIYPVGYEGSVVTYIESNSVPLASISQSTPLCIAFGFDYNNTGSYFVKAMV